ncbi:hypothetical protein LVJ94_25935 [Pendulispora rubella]|uniref:DUF1963 domain-containing protein n=1 Tax=Pendulispora rubella TaxID=2741070 RepID=A0ABZ2LIT1_9BACT
MNTPLPNLPCKAKIISFESGDGVGTLEIEGGAHVRFGGSACIGFMPDVGLVCWLIETKPNPVGGGIRAKTVNLTGAWEPDRLTQLDERNRQAQEWKQKEQDLLQSAGIKDLRATSCHDLPNMAADTRKMLAATLMAWKREGHFFDELFTRLVEVSPDVFHPYLSDLDAKREPESLAYVDAPFDAVAPLVRMLDDATEPPRRVQLEVGKVSTVLNARRDMGAASNEVGGAMLALARSGHPKAREAISSWFKRAPETAGDEAAGLLFQAGFGVAADGTLARTHSIAAYELRPVEKPARGEKKGLLSSVLRAFGARSESRSPAGSMWGTGRSLCGACHVPLIRVLKIGTAFVPHVLPDGLADEIEIWTCRNCVAVDFNPYYVKLGQAPESIFRDPPSSDFKPSIQHDSVSSEPAAVMSVPAPSRVNYMFAQERELNRVGGAPSWIQGADAVPCLMCGAVMPFLCQFADPPDDMWSGDCGMLYAFFCVDCRVVGTTVQCS